MFVGFNAPHAPSTPAPGDEGAFESTARPTSAAFDEADISDKPSFIRDLPPLSPRRWRGSTRVASEPSSRCWRSTGRWRGSSPSFAARASSRAPTSCSPRTTATSQASIGSSSASCCRTRPRPGCRCWFAARVPAGETFARWSETSTSLRRRCELGGRQAAIALDGRSLLPLRRATPAQPSAPLLLESLVRDRSTYYGYPYAAIRSGHFLYVEYATGDEELYNLDRDPTSSSRWPTTPSYEDNRRALSRALDQLRDCRGRDCEVASSHRRVEVPPLPFGPIHSPPEIAPAPRRPLESPPRAAIV